MPSRKQTTGFWQWLADNGERLQAGLKRDSPQSAAEIGNRFEGSYPGLTWEVSPAERGPWLFCVSADGDRTLFPRVTEAVRAAPAMTDWTIQPFRPRGSPEAEISLDGHTLTGDDIWCEVEPTTDRRASVVLHIRGVTVETEDALGNAALVLLDNAVGEYDAALKISEFDLALLEGKPKRSIRFFPLRDLPRFLDRLTIA